MSETITAQGRSVNTITAEILSITAQTNQMVVLSAIEVGRRLVEAKELVPRGEWGQYLQDEVRFSKSTANNLMKIYREYGEKQTNLQALGDLPYTKMVRLLAVPEEEREEFVQAHDVEALSTRELEQAIRDRDSARALLDVAQGSAAAAQQEAETLKQKNKELNDALLQSGQDAKKAQAEAKRLQREVSENGARLDVAKREGYAQARKEFEAKLADAEKAAQEALEKARAEAGASRPTEESQKKQRLADEEAVAFNLLFRQIQEQFNVLNGYLLKFQTSRPEFAAGAAKALRAMLRQWEQTVEEKTV